MSIWALMESRDNGVTWQLARGNNAFYRREATCKTKATNETRWHAENLTPTARAYGYFYRAVEFKEVA